MKLIHSPSRGKLGSYAAISMGKVGVYAPSGAVALHTSCSHGYLYAYMPMWW